MIRKKEQALKKEFKGVDFEVLAVGEHSMVTKMNYKAGDRVPVHSHPNEQSGYVISGKYKVTFPGYNAVLMPGDSYSVPADAAHTWEVMLPGEVIDVFTPVREDYL